MLSTTSVGYQPAVALQGEPQAGTTVNTTNQEPKLNTTQPKLAASAGTQTNDETSLNEREPDNDRDDGRGSKLNVVV